MAIRLPIPVLTGSLQPHVGQDTPFAIPSGATSLTGLFLSLGGIGAAATGSVQVRTAAGGGGSGVTASFSAGSKFATFVGTLDVTGLSTLYLRPTAASDASLIDLSGTFELDGSDHLTTLVRVRELGGRVIGAPVLQPPAFTADALDALIMSLISEVSERIRVETRRDLVQRTYTAEKYSASGRSDVLQLRQFPLVSVASISIDGTALAVVDYAFDAREKALGHVIYTPGGATTPSEWPCGRRHISVTYTAGYAAIPADLGDAAALQVIWDLARMASNRIGLRSTVLDQGTATYMVDAWDPNALSRIAPYREALR